MLVPEKPSWRPLTLYMDKTGVDKGPQAKSLSKPGTFEDGFKLLVDNARSHGRAALVSRRLAYDYGKGFHGRVFSCGWSG